MADDKELTPELALRGFTDSYGAAFQLGRSRGTVCDMVDRGVLKRYRVGTAVLYYLPEVLELAAALARIESGRPVPARSVRR